MSELNEDLLDDDFDDPDLINDEEEEKLLLDEEDIDDSGIIEKSAEESHLNSSEVEDKSERNKFSTERKKITAPERVNTADIDASKRTKLGTPGYQKNYSGRNHRGRPEGRPFNRRNKTVLINPRFQGILHVNNSAPFPWGGQHQNGEPPLNPWVAGADPHNVVIGPPQEMVPPMQMQAHLQVQSPQPHFQPPQYQSTPLPQPCPMQYQPPPPTIQPPERQVFVPQAVPIIINTAQPPPPIQHGFQQPQMNQPFVPQPQFNQHQQAFGQNQQYQPTAPPIRCYQQSFVDEQFAEFRGGFGDENYPERGGFQGWKSFQKNVNFVNKFQRNNVKSRIGPLPSNKFQKAKEVEREVVDRSTVIKAVPVKEEAIIEDEDDEMRVYRKKIEEQKRQREAFLRQKEEKRLKSLKVPPIPLETSKPPAAFPQLRKQRSPNIVVTNGYSRRLSKYQRNSKEVAAATVAEVVTVKAAEEEERIDVKQLPGFLQDRRVLRRDETLIDTRRVVVRNLSSSTADKKILMICRDIGDVQSLERDKDDRQATIVFKSVASAHAFYKKYQRYMLDLSMIEVRLNPEAE